MVAVLPIVYLGYMFISLYFLSLFLIIYSKNRKEIFSYPVAKRKYSISFIVPAFNEEKTIEDSIKYISDIDYSIKEIIIVKNMIV